jgi:hypothetical protein
MNIQDDLALDFSVGRRLYSGGRNVYLAVLVRPAGEVTSVEEIVSLFGQKFPIPFYRENIGFN